MTYSRDRKIDEKVRALVHDGWRVFPGGNHLRVEHPVTGYALSVPTKSGERRTVQNWFSQFRRAERAQFDTRVIFGGKR